MTEQQHEILNTLTDTVLFYPCSADDLEAPIRLFAPYIKEFWFADLSYFTRTPSSEVKPVLVNYRYYKLLDVKISGPETDQVKLIRNKWGKEIPDITPGVRTEFYEYIPSGDVIKVHRRRGYGPSALRSEIETDKLGVFFYRGDSDNPDTGGSGTLWLSTRPGMKSLIGEVLDKLIDGGFIVTDGSNCDIHNNPYAEFRRFYHQEEDRMAFSQSRQFEDRSGNKFQSVDYIFDDLHAATFFWRVSKPP